MNILLPWNLSYFIPLNGFHPLYRSILNYKGEHRLIIPRDDLLYTQYQYLAQQSLYSNKLDEEFWWIKDLDKNLKDNFYNFFSKREINYASYLPGDIEFLHTAPITKGERAFIVHIESFLPFFMPFSFQGKGSVIKILLMIKESYKKLLLKNCISIISHNKDTLEELSHFFNDSRIDSKLKYIPIGIPDEPINVTKNSKKINFLFIASAHQNLNNFIYRGGMVAIDIALKLLEKDEGKYQFIFRTRRPDNDSFISNGVDLKFLKKFEDSGDIIWIESSISEKSLKRLFAKSDFLFLTSASLHSDAILRAMMYGVIPIVTDIDPYNIYVDNTISIKIDGVKEYLIKCERENNTTIYYDDYSLFPDLHSHIVKQAVSKILNIDEKTKDIMSKKLIEKFKYNFDEKNMIESLSDIFNKQSINIKKYYNQNTSLLLGEDYIEDLRPLWFKTISQPFTIYRVGFGIMRKVFNSYLFFPQSQESLTNNLYAFSHINIIDHIYSKPINNRIEKFENIESSIQYFINITNPHYNNHNISTDRDMYSGKGLKQKYFLLKHKIIGYLKIFPNIYIFSKCSVNCLSKTLSEKNDLQKILKQIDQNRPTILMNIDGYNVILYKNNYYAIPKILGKIDFHRDDLLNNKDIFIHKRLNVIKKKIQKNRINCNDIVDTESKIPILIKTIDDFNIVKYKNQYYAIPHKYGVVKLESDNLSKFKDIIINEKLNILEKDIKQKRTLIKILKLNIRKVFNKVKR